MAMKNKLPQAGFKRGKGLSDAQVSARARDFHAGLDTLEFIDNDSFTHGISLSYRNLGKIAQAKIARQMEAEGKSPESFQYVYLAQPTVDDAVHSYFNNTPVTYDAVNNPEEISESAEKVKDWYMRSLGVTEMEYPKEDSFIPAGTNVFNKAMTSDVSVIHAFADTDMVILNSDVQIAQSIFRQEAAIGKDVMWDVSKPFNYAAPYFGTELQDFVDSDFELATRHDQLYFMYCNGEISTAAINFGLSANPRRDLMPLEIIQHQLGCRALRERRILGVDSVVNNPNFTWENHTEGLNYAGLHEFATNRIGHNEDQLSAIVNGADVYTGSETPQQMFETIMGRVNLAAYNMRKAGQTPKVMMTDWQTANLIATQVIPNIRIMDNSPTRAFGVTSIQLNVLSAGPMEMVVHPWMPSASGQSCIFMFDPQMMARRVGWVDVMKEIPNSHNDAKRFTINSAETFIDKTDVTGNHTLMGAVMNITHPDYAGGVVL